jgi:hypothetical protein
MIAGGRGVGSRRHHGGFCHGGHNCWLCRFMALSWPNLPCALKPVVGRVSGHWTPARLPHPRGRIKVVGLGPGDLRSRTPGAPPDRPAATSASVFRSRARSGRPWLLRTTSVVSVAPYPGLIGRAACGCRRNGERGFTPSGDESRRCRRAVPRQSIPNCGAAEFAASSVFHNGAKKIA